MRCARPLCSTLALLLALGLAAAAHAAPARTRLVRVTLSPAVTLASLQQAGFDIAFVKHGAYVDIHEWPADAAGLAALGATVVDDDVEGHAAARAAAELAARPRPAPARVLSAVRPDGVFRIEALPPFGSGSMGGYWTLAEVKMKLDSLVAGDTQDVVADKLDTIGTTVEGRPIWGLKLGKRVTGPDPRPVAFYNALAHAREPEGMQALFYFVDDLLAKYGSDPFATYLLDQRVIYIVPVANSDGYFYNQTTNPAGGGMWRKNRRDNGDGTFGVDLNRNFGYMWGLNNTGSSGTTSSDLYRGPSAFSEPETRAQRDIVAALTPRTGLSFHTYSDLFLHPWGYTPAATPDSLTFYEWNDEATVASHYIAGNAPRVLYDVNGEFNDWMYGDTLLKPKAFSWTPEVGNQTDGFWPAPSRIVPLAEENLRRCWLVAAIAGPYARVESSALVEGTLDAGNLAHLAVRARNLGLVGTPAGLSATLVALDAGTEVFPAGSACPYPTLAPRSSADATGGATFIVAAADSVTPGRLVRFELDFTASGGYFSRDTVELLVGTPTVLMVDACNDLANFTSTGGWGVVSTDPRHPDRYLADSPAGKYGASVNLRLSEKSRFDLSAGVHAWALLEDRYMLEQDFDYSALEASLDSVTWTPMPARTASSGVFAPQPAGQPVWQAARWLWKPDRVDLSSMAGPAGSAVRLRFRTVSDAGAQYDGFNFDSLRILLFDPASQPAPVAVGAGPAPALDLAPPAPNPARELARFSFALPRAGDIALDILDLAGRRVRSLAHGRYPADRYVLAWDLRDDAGRPVAPGVYLARLSGAAGKIARRLVVLR
ncbi:MAG: immune inhibitor A [Candidatus Eisenbacteria bacterium]|nr:immune inhibitor A [Candidatus Eisenbacteria bacterium]